VSSRGDLPVTSERSDIAPFAPANANVAPPSYNMLFVIDANGVPSVAPFVRLQWDARPTRDARCVDERRAATIARGAGIAVTGWGWVATQLRVLFGWDARRL
jgi:hypothetical protein